MSTAKVMIDSYAILGVTRDASTKEINAAYKRLALKLHPDKAGNEHAAIERFQKVSVLYHRAMHDILETFR